MSCDRDVANTPPRVSYTLWTGRALSGERLKATLSCLFCRQPERGEMPPQPPFDPATRFGFVRGWRGDIRTTFQRELTRLSPTDVDTATQNLKLRRSGLIQDFSDH